MIAESNRVAFEIEETGFLLQRLADLTESRRDPSVNLPLQFSPMLSARAGQRILMDLAGADQLGDHSRHAACAEIFLAEVGAGRHAY